MKQKHSNPAPPSIDGSCPDACLLETMATVEARVGIGFDEAGWIDEAGYLFPMGSSATQLTFSLVKRTA